VLQTNDALLSALSSVRYGRPTGLGVVLDRGVATGKVMRTADFRGAEGSIYEKGWLKSLKGVSVGDVVRWSLRSIGVLSSNTFDKDGGLRMGECVLIDALEDVAGKVMRWWEGRGDKTLTGRIFSREEFVRHISPVLGLGGTSLGKEDLELLLLHLQRDKGVLSYNETTIKFRPQNTTTPEPITPEDTSIANLHLLITNLSIQITQLETHIATLQSKAAAAVKASNKRSALSALKSKSLATKSLDKKTATLQQLEQVYTQIQQAADQITIINTLRESAGVLKGLNRQVDVGEVEEVMDVLREEMGRTGEVHGVLGEGLGEDAAVDGEVDEEFEAMEREERVEREKREAEATAKRLEGIGAGSKVPEQANGVVGKEEDLEKELSSSVERLQRLKLDSKSPGPEEERKRKEEERRRREEVAQVA
jgi:charged multivesicular body protein 7